MPPKRNNTAVMPSTSKKTKQDVAVPLSKKSLPPSPSTSKKSQDMFTLVLDPSQDSRVSVPQPQVSQETETSQISRKTLEKLISQNAKIISKLDTIISSQKILEERMSKLEQLPETAMNEELIKTIVSDIARSLINKSIYPTQEEFNREAERVFTEEHQDLFKKIRNKWNVYYEKHIYQRVS